MSERDIVQRAMSVRVGVHVQVAHENIRVRSSPVQWVTLLDGSPTLYGKFLTEGGARTPSERPAVVRGDPLSGVTHSLRGGGFYIGPP